MRSIFLFVLISLIASNKLEAQCHGFVQNTMGDTAAISVSSVIDANDNVYTVGYFQGIVTVGTTTLKTTTLPIGIFITKIDKNGEFVYTKLIAEAISADVKSPNIAVGSNEIMIEGVVHDSLSISGKMYSQAGTDHVFFIIKLDLGPSLIWSQVYYYHDALNLGGWGGIVSDKNGGAFVTTNFRDTMNVGSKQFIGLGLPVLVLHIDKDGNIVWTKASSLVGGYAKKIALDGAGNVIVGGELESGIQFDSKFTGSGTADSIYRLYVASFSNDGSLTNWLWSQQPNAGAKKTNIRPLLTDLKCDHVNNILISGEIGDSIQFDNIKLVGRFAMYIGKINSSGAIVWAQQKSGHVSGRPEFGYLALDSNQNIYMAGTFVDSTYFGTQKYSGVKGGSWFTAHFIDSAHWDHVVVGQNTGTAYPQSIVTTSRDSIVVVAQFVGNSTSYNGLTATNGTDNNSNAYNLAWFGSCAVGSGVDEPLPFSDGISIYPNPVSGQLNIKFKNDFSGIAGYRIVNELGVDVLRNRITSDNGVAEIPFGQSITPGIYFLIVQASGLVFSKKFVVR